MPKKVCVIGAGPCGLTTIKQCRDEGLEVTCFEREGEVGGIWNRNSDDKSHMKVFDSLYLTISAKMMSFSDMMTKGDRVFMTHAEYQSYLEMYAQKYELSKHVNFWQNVVSVEKKGNKWFVTTECRKKMTQKTTEYDAVAVASGPFQNPKPLPENLAGFTGEVHHSSLYRNNADYKGKKVLILGLAESGADIVREISDVAGECTLSIRSYSFLLPRLFQGYIPTDKGTWRLHHYEMHANTEYPLVYKGLHGAGLTRYIFYPILVFWSIVFSLFTIIREYLFINNFTGVNNLHQPMLPLKLDRDCLFDDAHTKAIEEWNAKAHKGASTWAPKIIFAKNVTWIRNLVAKKFDLNDTGIDHAEGKKVFFKNGDVKEFDTVMLCTGFFKKFDRFGKDTSVPENNVRYLYKHTIHPEHNGSLAFVGWCRPFTGGIPICSEMQARYFAAINSGRVKLPKDLSNKIKKEKVWEDYWTQYSPCCNEATPSQAMYMDEIALELGCVPTAWDMILNPRLMIAMFVAPFNQACYRIKGKGAMGKEAWDELYYEYPVALNSLLTIGLCIFWITDLIPKPFSLRPKHLGMIYPTKYEKYMSTATY